MIVTSSPSERWAPSPRLLTRSTTVFTSSRLLPRAITMIMSFLLRGVLRPLPAQRDMVDRGPFEV